jgi:hypothetical protein
MKSEAFKKRGTFLFRFQFAPRSSRAPLGLLVAITIPVGLALLILTFGITSDSLAETICSPAENVLDWQKKIELAIKEVDELKKKLECQSGELMSSVNQLRELMDRIDARRTSSAALPKSEETRKTIMDDMKNLRTLMKKVTEKSNGMVADSRNASKSITNDLRGCLDSMRNLYQGYITELRHEFEMSRPPLEKKLTPARGASSETTGVEVRK